MALAGCVAAGSTGTGGSRNAMSFTGGQIRSAAPEGYCLDPAASRDSADAAVMVITRCSANNTAIPAIITVTVGAEGSAEVLKSGAKALSDYFASPAGRAALARDGSAGSVVVRQTGLAGGALMMKMVDRSVGEYWRAVLGLKGRLVTIAVTQPETSSLSPEQSRALLERTLTALRAANGTVTRTAAGAGQ